MSLTDIMSSMNLATYPIIALIIFTSIFIGVIITVIRGGQSAEDNALLPFSDESESRHSTGKN
ncbi:MAG: hypothetical protein ACK54H_00510 [Phycisphaerales bacterium]|jgi:hypothetical protein